MHQPWKPMLPVLAGVMTAALSAAPASGFAAPIAPSTPHYDHIFVIVEENHGFADVIGNPAAPNLNALARQFGLATSYFGISHPSEPNYVALLGGNTFGVADDNPYYINTVNKPSLISQLDAAGVSWKAYLQSLPYPGYQGICYPAKCNGTPDNDPLYVSKHDGIQNFTTSRVPRDWARQVPIQHLAADLASGNVPAFDYVIPTECQDQHGDPPYCIDSGTPGDSQDQRLVATGDRYLGSLVSKITRAPFWSRGNNAVVISYDEGDDNKGCCDAGNGDPNGTGGGQVATVVVTSHGPRAIQDPTPYNHYSLLRTIQQNFGLGCIEFTCDVANVKPLSPLFAVTGATAVATSALAVPDLKTPTPTPVEPVSSTTLTPTSGGWQVVASPLFGTGDNSLGAVSASAPNDVWAVGNFLPDTSTSNPDATLNLADHFDGNTWTVTLTPNSGPNFNTLLGVAARAGKAWAVGVTLNSRYQDRALIEAWDGARWSVVSAPQPGARRDILFAVSASSASDVWAVGDQQGVNGKFETLVEHWSGAGWTVVPSPNPGSTGNHLYGVTALGPDDVWAVGQQNGSSSPDEALIEHWDGKAWSVTRSPAHGGASAILFSIAAGGGDVWAAGETNDEFAGAHALVERFHEGVWTTVSLPNAGSIWIELWGVTVSDGTVSAVGTFLNLATGNNDTLILRGTKDGFSVVDGPNPGSGTHILGAVAAAGDTLWAVGHYDDGGSRLTLIEKRPEG